MAKKDNSRSRSPQSSSRISGDVFRQYNEQKNLEQSDLKLEMLKLPIFQNSNNNPFDR